MLTQDDTAKDQINTDRVTSAIFDADSKIEGKLHKRYIVPFDPVPDVLIRVSVDLAIFYLYRARYDNAMPDAVKEAYNEAIAYLNDLRDGTEVLQGAEYLDDTSPVILTNCTRYTRHYNNHGLRQI